MPSMNNTRTATLNLVVQIDAERANLLCQQACGADAIDQEGRFELRDGDVITPSQETSWKGGTLMWCENALEAIVLSDYEAVCRYESLLLWDLAADSTFSGHVVLSSRPWRT